MKPDLDELISYLPAMVGEDVQRNRRASAVPGWDGPGTLAVDDATWRDAVRTALRLSANFPRPARILPRGDGSVRVDWTKPADRTGPSPVEWRIFLVETRGGRFTWTWTVGKSLASEGESGDLEKVHHIASILR